MRRACALVGIVVALAACGTALGALTRSGIAGRVVAAPICPVETFPPRPECAPRALAATLRIRHVRHRRPVITVHSGADGRFRVRLVPGEYEVQALAQPGSPYPRPPRPFDVRVRAGRFTRVTITY